MEVWPTNSYERIFNIICLCSSLILGSSLISSMSASMMRLKMLKQDQMKNIRLVRRFLRQNSVRSEVAVRVEKQVTQRMMRKERVTDRDVQALAMLSPAVNASLQTELFGKHLNNHPLFALALQIHAPTLHRFCCECLHGLYLSSDDDLFGPGTEASETYFVVEGELQYTEEPETSPGFFDRKRPIEAPTWICEAALWSQWFHVGAVEALRPCQLVVLKVAAMLKTAGKNRVIVDLFAEYARVFHKRLISAGPPMSEWPDDLHVPLTDYCDIIASTKPDVRCFVGQLALRKLPFWFSTVRHDALREEISSGKCIIVQNADGEMMRVVTLVTLRILRADGCMLVRLGKLRHGPGLEDIELQLPGAKQDPGDTPEDTACRVLRQELAPFADDVHLSKTEREVSFQESSRLKLRTKYCKTVHYAELQSQAVIGVACHAPRVSRASMFSSAECSPIEQMTILIGHEQDAPTAGAALAYVYTWMAPGLFAKLHSGSSLGPMRPLLESIDFGKLVRERRVSRAVADAAAEASHGSPLGDARNWWVVAEVSRSVSGPSRVDVEELGKLNGFGIRLGI